jgi:transcriptional regulator with GAF, ATPase, and Fis domain
MPEKARDALKRKWAKMQTQDVMIFNRSESDPVTHTITQLVRKPNTSAMVMRLRMEDNRLGAVVMYVEGRDRYTNAHSDLMSLVHDPFAIAMSNALKHERVLNFKDKLTDDVHYLHQELLRITGDELVGKNGGLKRITEMVHQVATLDSPVLLLGETGVGKEVIANFIHHSSSRKEGPFIKVNCGAIPETLVDSELFGHEKGAFTGATTQKRGRFERAQKGTILLDEIGELPLQVQVRLLRVLQSKEIERVGGSTTIPIDVRIISATQRNLEDMINQGSFREDLWFRLNVFPIMIPPLRQRKEDVTDFVHHFVNRKSKEMKFKTVPTIFSGGIEQLKDYHWPGNVRELENVIERALIQNRGNEEGLPLTFKDFIFQQKQENNENSLRQDKGIVNLNTAISQHIQKTLNATNGKIEGKGGAAELLELNPSTLRAKMRKLGIQRKKK